ncbi:MAG: hypothetical protein PHP62_05465 [Candidatus Moranbacteria bacterium]|nr:hypothetical protein [Candidatus Moranbacteria bacterium]
MADEEDLVIKYIRLSRECRQAKRKREEKEREERMKRMEELRQTPSKKCDICGKEEDFVLRPLRRCFFPHAKGGNLCEACENQQRKKNDEMEEKIEEERTKKFYKSMNRASIEGLKEILQRPEEKPFRNIWLEKYFKKNPTE